MAKIGIVLGSIREGRLGEQVAAWVLEQARQRGDAEYSLVDVKSFDLPLVTGAPPATRNKQYDDERVQRWSDTIDALDGYVFVTPEYNHGVPGAFKNAVDHLAPEFFGKAIGFVGYSGDGAIRAVEQWRTIVALWGMRVVAPEVHLTFAADVRNRSELVPADNRAGQLAKLLDAVVEAAG
ncbi:NAD(P)H-dependent oxidoreductase [Actinomyces sp. ZJ308]|uniref:NADPH-dependent FMN reductase n=1 Tax=Actinomyces sp. ZJ308 TaxID=2708342 RepID=UPI0014213098|nr:NAD(P)H-dependent oxidoreductase [Actinomyces sp. ZJ308]